MEPKEPEVIAGFEKHSGEYYAYVAYRGTELAGGTSSVSQEDALRIMTGRLARKLAAIIDIANKHAS